ncbi:FecCD family ABC transporter permease [Gloeocapsopsis dulcis]|uniref:Iron ABC transporter permease n=1 Tax=Gloeocapsopsis dulcis AAB1 = 1H9 TaxID=1433147 RepID=A0A6N8G196_9CHRO|nr:iron ABC transporter permease [Gloeocapsopsis dulcis]MUL38869.1 iron ABC transporter permease [Gloeocapsopsis dulcis AAB1 = 1H9]WNN89300.1 iron ABC transporter permease [Gloeocapsopsis dulcis]
MAELASKEQTSRSPLIGLIISIVLLMICLFVSIALGAADISLKTIYEAIAVFDGSTEHLIIRTVRVPRSLLAILVGAATAIAGAIMQGISRNPLADPEILGINAGAAFAVVIAVFLFGTSEPIFYVWCAFLGAGVSAVSVYLLGSLGRGGMTPLNLTIAGAAIAALLSAITTGILIISQRTLDEIRFWLAGSVAGRDYAIIGQVLPYIIIGIVLALALARQINILNLGEDVAKGLGQKTAWVKIAAAVAVLLLAGSAVAAAGPIGFIGLVVPHIVRLLIGIDYRWLLPYSAVLGAILLLASDVVARLIIQPQELPVGIVTALVGAPFFVYLARIKVSK